MLVDDEADGGQYLSQVGSHNCDEAVLNATRLLLADLGSQPSEQEYLRHHRHRGTAET